MMIIKQNHMGKSAVILKQHRCGLYGGHIFNVQPLSQSVAVIWTYEHTDVCVDGMLFE